MLLHLQTGILYGPVKSRRFGKSLGINLMPAQYKFCSFNCVYCHYGATQEHTVSAREFLADLPALENVVKALDQAVKSSVQFDFITFSGNGEPTLYPWFAELVEELIRLRNRYRPNAKLCLLSNSTGLSNKKVRDAVSNIDFPVMKLDAGTERTFRAVNRPAKGIEFQEIIDNLCSLRGIIIQTALIGGNPSNVEEKELGAYFQQIARIRPEEVHLYSIDRPVPDSRITLIPPEELSEIAARGEKETKVRMKIFHI